MALGVNKAILLGRVGQDPKVHSSENSIVVNLSMATSESWKDKNSGEKVEKTEWHNVVFFGKVAEIVRQYVSKGVLIYVEGKIQTSKYQDKETGQDRYSTKIIGDKIQLLSMKDHETSPAPAPATQGEFFDDPIPF